ncbi:cytochrome b/b6 domain-containing protein [Aliivibrio salmonicida]|uniref:cytochrome b/b6 domain-containing protein n=1 Tax=Aliivibrio salmonicida TaxID=40269 RepID=UPI003D0DE8E3
MKIWDLSTRLYHWLQAFLFVGLAASGFNGQGPHIYLGLALFTLLIWRITWGFIGSDTSRFNQFVSSPKHIINYLLGKGSSKIGHNPVGSWMVIVMIIVLSLQCFSGLLLAGLFDQFSYTEIIITDRLFDLIASLHVICARFLLALVGLHLLAILWYKLRSKPLVLAMITGIQKHTTHYPSQPTLVFASNKRALLVLVAAGLVTIAIVVTSQV